MLSMIPALVEQSKNLAEDLPGNVASLQDRWSGLREISDRFNLTRQVEGVISSLPERLSSGVFGFTGRIASTVASILTIAVVTVYFMVDLPRVRRSVELLFPRAHRAEVGRIADVMVDKVGGYMIGNITTSLIAGLASFVAFTAIGVPFALPLAFVVAVTDLIPLIGATIGAVICVLVTLVTVGLWPDAVLVAVFLVLYQQLENYVMSPRIMRKPIQLSPAAILLASLIGAGALGLIGALMAIPFAAGINVLLSERLKARDAADSGATAPEGDGQPAA
jgi:predicted PurR-regulated permease PerM